MFSPVNVTPGRGSPTHPSRPLHTASVAQLGRWRGAAALRCRLRVLALCLGIAAAACSTDEGRIRLSVAGQQFDVELAVTPEQRREGLMYRDRLGEREGMLFVFDREQMLTFWMRNTPLPLSIAFIDARGVIVHITDMVPFSEVPVSSQFPARFALEVNRGAFARAGVAVGDLVELPARLR